MKSRQVGNLRGNVLKRKDFFFSLRYSVDISNYRSTNIAALSLDDVFTINCKYGTRLPNMFEWVASVEEFLFLTILPRDAIQYVDELY
jgi:hypothetical protein